MRIHSRYRGQSGFSLIEVMNAVIVLATGLLALAALQINLTSSSADAKARSRIASLLASTIDDERAAGFANILTYAAAGAGSSVAPACSAGSSLQNAICNAQQDAGVSGLKVAQTVTESYGLPGGSSFNATQAQCAAAPICGDYKKVDITATWKDATGGARSLAATTMTSDSILTALANLTSQGLTFSGSLVPVVHETNPGNTTGVIPIAIGSNTNAASTNPKPTVSASGANSTTFSTLNYTQGVNDTNSTSTIQKRVETEVAECVCQGSNSNPFGSSTLEAENVFRPTYWNGTLYTSPTIVSGGVPHSAAATSITQSTECDVCCRDHNDTGVASGQVLYDSVTLLPPSTTTRDTNRYKVKTSGSTIITPVSLATDVSGNLLVADVKKDSYLDACRMIRVDGLWRVATDIEASHMGLIVTKDENGSATNPAAPANTFETLYTTFVVAGVKQYLLTALPSAGSPEWTSFLANTLAGLFATSAPNVPPTNPVTVDTLGTYRYLHVHGMYIDHLETEAINKLNSVMSTCPSNSTSFPTCLLPYLPFSTINVSGLAAWTDTKDTTDQAGTIPLNKTVLSLGSGTNSASTCSTGAFFGGCVTGLTTGYAFATATIGHSNSGIAASIPVNPYEQIATNNLTASQQFNASNTSSSDLIYAQVFGPDLTPSGFASLVQFPTDTLNSAINPAVTWATGASNGNCSVSAAKHATTPNPYSCATPVTITAPTTITVNGYNQAVAVAAQSATDPSNVGGSSKNKTYPIPGLVCYKVSTATLSTDAAGATRIDCNALPTPASCYNITSPFSVTNTKTAGETSAVTIASKTGTPVALSNTYLNLTYVANGSALGTLSTSTCAASGVPTITAPTSCP
jgi:Tfp pilus assembly protein PilV